MNFQISLAINLDFQEKSKISGGKMKEINANNESKWKDLFVKSNRQETITSITNYINTLNGYVSNYHNDKSALLKGERKHYKEFLDLETLPIESLEADEVLRSLSQYFQRCVQWEKPETMINITPPANILSIASASYANLYNPNFAQDEPAGFLLATELAVIKFLSQMVDWDYKKSGGVFTFGGKGINLYAGKIGLLKAIPNVRYTGLQNQQACIISNDKSHPCHVEISDWLGIGRNNCIIVPTDKEGRIDLEKFKQVVREKLDMGKVVSCIIVNGGTTNETIVDPIKQIVEIRNELAKEYNLDYLPHIHVDSVIGWAWLSFKYYDFDKNELNMSDVEKSKIKSMLSKIEELHYADSFGVDFHKTGFCPYVSSCIVVKDKKDLYDLGGKVSSDIDTLKHGEYSPFEWTLELTRSSSGAISAYTAIKLFGMKGLQELIYRVFSTGEHIRSMLKKEKDFDIINMQTEGFATLFVVLPPNKSLKYEDYVKGDELQTQELLEYNNQFFLFLQQKFEAGEIGFKITFSKSYKPFNGRSKTGCLKIYQTSPVRQLAEVENLIKQLIELKKIFDSSDTVYKDDICKPSDFVYR